MLLLPFPDRSILRGGVARSSGRMASYWLHILCLRRLQPIPCKSERASNWVGCSSSGNQTEKPLWIEVNNAADATTEGVQLLGIVTRGQSHDAYQPLSSPFLTSISFPRPTSHFPALRSLSSPFLTSISLARLTGHLLMSISLPGAHQSLSSSFLTSISFSRLTSHFPCLAIALLIFPDVDLAPPAHQSLSSPCHHSRCLSGP
jgi:hypothetical protein